ncbi:lysophosphatidic acid:oleoyl-CoA acyltransferase 1 [[Candida] railenensis]|uniref:Lysophosphatidic acid:oleoyl-CoA acyltransferase 1 n=1 Tax=[Candida] railenensis TaxID=45579 RepID=A0A9P0QQ16_9ASCO|nr:lysophosphatidic acid:oleoyl-CoA acyltransferase 1 [[Candida] railenensis]
MEKFSTWRDKGTGISPFMPVDAPPSSIASKYLAQPVLYVFKFPILIITLALYYALIPFPAVANFIVTKLYGFRRIETTVDGLKRSKVAEIQAAKPKVNDIVVVNYVAPINGLILASIAQCSWRSIVILIPAANGEYYSYSIWDVFTRAMDEISTPNPSAQPITDLTALKGKLVFIFPEGTPSNNRSILPFVTSKTNKLKVNNVFTFKTLSLKISPLHFTTPLPLTSKFAYVYSLLTNLHNKSVISVKIFEHGQSNELDFNLSKRSFETNQLNSVGDYLDIQMKEKFYAEYIKVKR